MQVAMKLQYPRGTKNKNNSGGRSLSESWHINIKVLRSHKTMSTWADFKMLIEYEQKNAEIYAQVVWYAQVVNLFIMHAILCCMHAIPEWDVNNTFEIRFGSHVDLVVHPVAQLRLDQLARMHVT